MKTRTVAVAAVAVVAALLPTGGMSSPASAASGINVSGTIVTDTTWTAADSPVTVTGPVTIPAGVTVTVEPGVTIQDSTTTASTTALFAVAGSFVAHGTSDAPVHLSSTKYHPVFAGPTGSVVDTATGVVELERVSLGYEMFLPPPATTTTAMARVSITDSHVNAPNSSMSLYRTREITLARNAFVLGVGAPIYTSINLGPGRITTTIVDNRFRGAQIRCEGGPLTLRNNTFEWMAGNPGGQGSGIRVMSPSCPVDARGNYWENGGDLAQRIYDGRDAIGLPIVDVSTQLDAPTAATPHLPPGLMGYVQQRAYVTGLTAWWDPANSGGLPLTYTIGAYPVGSATPEQEIVSAGPYVVFHGLDPAQEYLLKIVAYNDLGTTQTASPEAIQPAVEATVPSKPTVDLSLQSRAVTVSFRSESDGGTPIDYYQWFIDGPNLEGTTGSGGLQTWATFTGLTPGEQYTVTVYAVNAMGQSETTAIPFTAAGAPPSPRKVTAVRGDKSVQLTWAPVVGVGTAATSYQIVQIPGNRVVRTTKTPSTTVTGLDNGTSYRFAVRAYNAVGASDPSAPSASVTPAGQPGRAPGVRVRAGQGTVTLTWRPAPANGDPITSYRVVTTQGKTITLPARVHALTVRELKKGTKVGFALTAVNHVGAGAKVRTPRVAAR